MIKVAMIGAGSVVFSRNLTGDILSFPEFRDATHQLHGHRRRSPGGGREPLPQGRPDTGRDSEDRGDARSPPGPARGGFRHQHGADRRVRFDPGRFRNSPQIRPAFHHRRHHRPRRIVPGAAHFPDAHRPLPRHDGTLPARPAAELFQSHVHEHADDRPHQRRPRRRPVPQRPGDLRSS